MNNEEFIKWLEGALKTSKEDIKEINSCAYLLISKAGRLRDDIKMIEKMMAKVRGGE